MAKKTGKVKATGLTEDGHWVQVDDVVYPCDPWIAGYASRQLGFNVKITTTKSHGKDHVKELEVAPE